MGEIKTIKKEYLKEFILLLIISGIFLTLSILNLKYVGISSDGALSGIRSPYFATKFNCLAPSDIRLFGIGLPLNMIQPYAFSLIGYLLIPFYVVFGANIASLKMLSVFTTWLTLLMLYYVLKSLFNKKIAIITNLLLVFSPLFIHYARIGHHVTELILNFFFIGAVFFLSIVC